MPALVCIFCATAAVELHAFIGSPGGFPAVCVLLAGYLAPSSIALWIQLDAHNRGETVAYDFDNLVFFLWVVVAPIYLFRTRGLRAVIPIAAFFGVSVLAHLFALFLGYPKSMGAISF